MKNREISIIGVIGLAISLLAPFQTAQAAVSCVPTTATAKTPKAIAVPSRTLLTFPAVMTLKTNCGDIDIELAPNAAPITVTSIITLARGGYYDGTLCHRLTTSSIYVIQCGDPLANGLGGPGWTFADENLPAAANNNYPAGTIAMANAGPGTNSSQFFITYKDSTLPPNYSIWGRVIAGLDIVKFIASKGVAGGKSTDGPPALSLGIDSVEEGDPYALRMLNKGIQIGAGNIGSLQTELTNSKSALKNLENKLARICKVKPKPKGC